MALLCALFWISGLSLALAQTGALRPLCADRPGKGTSACTLDNGHFQIEFGAFDTVHRSGGGATSDAYYAFSPTFKYGLADNADLSVSINPIVQLRSRNASGMQKLSGAGDTYIRGKLQLTPYGGAFAATLQPFLKAPTARPDIGNGMWEGGIVAPLSWTISDNWSIAASPEFDITHNGAGSGYHGTLVNVLGINRSLNPNLSLGLELWTSDDFDPEGTTQSRTFDLALAWQPDSELQLDAGLNMGFDRQTGNELYIGISRRF